MSLGTWKEEFYPIPANACKKKDSLAHSLQKWIGFRKANLKKHRVRFVCNQLVDNLNRSKQFSAAGLGSCALCTYHYGDMCIDCPLLIARKNVKCFKSNSIEMSPYSAHIKKGDPNPMIRLIRKAIKQSKKKGV